MALRKYTLRIIRGETDSKTYQHQASNDEAARMTARRLSYQQPRSVIELYSGDAVIADRLLGVYRGEGVGQ